MDNHHLQNGGNIQARQLAEQKFMCFQVCLFLVFPSMEIVMNAVHQSLFTITSFHR